MKNLNDIGITALATRLKRLYDNLYKDVREAYSAYQFEFDPKWFAVVYALIENRQLSITELSKILGLSHPSIIQILKELEKIGWVTSVASKDDGRVRLLELSDEAKAKVPELQSIWSDMRKAVESINDEGQVDFWSGLLEFEASLSKKSFKDRVLEIQTSKRSALTDSKAPDPWFDRKFDFAHLSTTPNVLYERLSFTAIRIREMVRNISSEAMVTSQDKWSVKQNIGHLTDLEPIWYGRVQDILNGKEHLRTIDLTNKKTHEADHNYLSVEKLISNFSAQRKLLLQICSENFDKLDGASALHPRLQIPMRIMDLMYFVAEHDDHHLSTIRHIIHKSN